MQAWAWMEAKRAFEARHGLPLPQADSLLPALRRHELGHNEAAFETGAVVPRVFLVREGLLKQQYLDADGRATIKSFAGAGEFFACPFALVPGGRSSFASIAIGAAVVESLDFAAVEALAARQPAWQLALRVAFQRLAELKTARERDLLMLSAEERVRALLRARPLLFEQVAQKELAGYFGLTPVGLSRILTRVRNN